uniref:Uncharacterized protein n=1 Tax=Rhizophora mucronata TaxID=61149 RepID=A0A2P2Q962_RHIMU
MQMMRVGRIISLGTSQISRLVWMQLDCYLISK